ncbi:oxysterol-binding protein-related protein [Acrasis kona]|uniref:Osbpl5 n=1 Tax=Acrasis kona TaxID=1008807 RepID=A0AAW2YNT8_9EUKA
MTSEESKIVLPEDRLLSEEYIYAPDYKGKRSGGSSGSILFNFLKQIRIGMDLTSVTCPSFILRHQSQLEVQARVSEPVEPLFKLRSTTDPKQRMLLVTEWAIRTISALPQRGFENLKPYNPILGELFSCKWEHEDGSTTKLQAEQVSHHPPVSATRLINREHGFWFDSTQQIHVYFRGNYIESDLSGVHELTINYNDKVEKYTIKYPIVYARGLIFGDAMVELGGTLNIKCEQNGTSTEIKFKSGNRGEGYVYLEGKKAYKLTGCVLEAVTVKEYSSGQETNFEPMNLKTSTMQITKLSEQMKNESRRVWHPVTFALLDDDLESASRFKNDIEEAQRQKAKEFDEANHQPVHFVKLDGEETQYQYKSNIL